MAKRVFKVKTFARWAKKILTDAELCAAAREIEQGIFDADLGGGVCKKRIAIPGQGKSGSTRTLAAKSNGIAIFFLFGLEKNDADNFSDEAVEAAKLLAKSLESASNKQLDAMVKDETIKEICHEPKREKQKK